MQRNVYNRRMPWSCRMAAVALIILFTLGTASAKDQQNDLKKRCPQLAKILDLPSLPARQSELLAIAQGEGYCKSMTQLSLGNLYVSHRDFRQARYWWKQAALQKNSVAQYNLGMLYHKGQGTKKDDTKALYWWEQAAEEGNALMQYRLGIAYLKGTLGVKDQVKAAYWMEQAAQKNHRKALSELGYMYSHGIGVPVNMAKSTQYYQRAAVLGDPTAMYNIGFHYEIGLGINRNGQMAAMWFKKALNHKIRCAANDLGILYAKGNGVQRNKLQSLAYFKHALLMETEHPDLIWQNKYMSYNQVQAEIYAQYMYAKVTNQQVKLSANQLKFAQVMEQRFARMCWQ